MPDEASEVEISLESPEDPRLGAQARLAQAGQVQLTCTFPPAAHRPDFAPGQECISV